MGDVVNLNPPQSETETQRARFERWAGSMVPINEASSLLARSRGGDYVLATARAAWAAWQARALLDEKEMISCDPQKPVF